MKKIILISMLAFVALTTYGVVNYYQNIDNKEIIDVYMNKPDSKKVTKTKPSEVKTLHKLESENPVVQEKGKSFSKKTNNILGKKILKRSLSKTDELDHDESRSQTNVALYQTKQTPKTKKVVTSKKVKSRAIEMKMFSRAAPMAVQEITVNEENEAEEAVQANLTEVESDIWDY